MAAWSNAPADAPTTQTPLDAAAAPVSCVSSTQSPATSVTVSTRPPTTTDAVGPGSNGSESDVAAQRTTSMVGGDSGNTGPVDVWNVAAPERAITDTQTNVVALLAVPSTTCASGRLPAVRTKFASVNNHKRVFLVDLLRPPTTHTPTPTPTQPPSGSLASRPTAFAYGRAAPRQTATHLDDLVGRGFQANAHGCRPGRTEGIPYRGPRGRGTGGQAALLASSCCTEDCFIDSINLWSQRAGSLPGGRPDDPDAVGGRLGAGKLCEEDAVAWGERHTIDAAADHNRGRRSRERGVRVGRRRAAHDEHRSGRRRFSGHRLSSEGRDSENNIELVRRYRVPD